MRILIATGIYPPDIGGPATYAKNLADEFLRRGCGVKVITYSIEKKLPLGIRHFVYFLKTIFNFRKTSVIIALDTFSVGLPSVLAAKIFRKKIIIRTGGDFLWENYIESTGNLITLNEFYANMPKLSLKQKIIFFLSKFVLKNCTALVFSSEWQKNIFEKNYGLDSKKSFIIENFYGEKIASIKPREKNFIFAGRLIKLKNLEMLKDAFKEASKKDKGIKLEIVENLPHENLIKKIQKSYAIILPSLSEISPNFILEAISANKPFIMTKETGLYEKLKNTGIFINPMDKEDIKAKVLFLDKEKNYYEYKNRIANFNFTHSWQEIADEFLEVYKKL
ncbi:glycosyltransferase family 4 protein [Patescibacteria group bacterium]|nr:glycosyltransferase family 4 protein [Patescibacteria group bacterium]